MIFQIKKIINKRTAFILLFSLFFLFPVYSGGLSLLSPDGTGLVYEFKAKEISVESEIAKGETFDRISIKGLGTTSISGAPLIPVEKRLINIPPNKEVSYKVIGSSSKVFRNINLYPSPEIIPQKIKGNITVLKRFFKDGKIYQKNEFYPKNIIKIIPSGFLRDKKIATLNAFPVQYNPVTKEMKFYYNIKVKISFKEEGNIQTFKTAFSPEVSVFNDIQISPLKISVEEDGIYRITFSDLKQAGIDPSALDPRLIKIFNKEKEMAIFFSGEDDGTFDEGDYFEFYGEQNKGEYANINTYWLIVNGEAGKRMGVTGTPYSKSSAFEKTFTAIYSGEENKIHEQVIPREEGKDHWFWQDLLVLKANTSESFDTSFTLNNINKKKGKVSLRVLLYGLTDDPLDPDHHTGVYLNDKLVDDKTWNGMIEYLHSVEIPGSLLKKGKNTLSIKLTGDTGAKYDGVVLNRFELEYQKRFVAENNSLTFTKNSNKKCRFRITNFSKKQVKVFDISDPYETKLVKTKVKKIRKKFAVQFADEINEEKTYIAIAKDKIKSPLSIEIDEESGLKSSENGADYIIITHEDFYNAIIPLKEYREGQGLRVEIVKISDVYDEFSSGNFTPDAIRDFLEYAYENWQKPAPSYVLLVGDANYDYKDYLGKGFRNYIPVKLVQTLIFGPTPSDNWFASVTDEDGVYDKLPDIYIGRIPAKTEEDVMAVIEKIQAYESLQPFSEWNNNILLVAGDANLSIGDTEKEFENLSDGLANLLPDPFVPQKVYLLSNPGANDISAAKAKIKENINNGALVTNYTGHGSLTDWASKIFTADDIPSLSNSERLTFVVTLDCLNGFFPDYEKESMGEKFFLAKDKGAIAYWGPTGLGFNSDYEKIGSELFTTLFTNNEKTAGKAVVDALTSAVGNNSLSEDYLEDLVYFGDPALQLGFP